MEFFLVASAAFFVAGLVKGVVGFGFPIVALIILTLSSGLLDALALIVVPTLLTNVWQALSGAYLRRIIERMWLYFLLAVAGIIASSQFLDVVDANLLTGLLGTVLVFYALSQLFEFRLRIARGHERLLSVILGGLNGLLTGLTGSFMVPSVLYMQALEFPRDMLVQAMGVFFAISTLTLALSLTGNGLITSDDAGWSTAALVPSFIGLYGGRYLRHRIDEQRFQTVFLAGVLLLGAYIAWRSFG